MPSTRTPSTRGACDQQSCQTLLEEVKDAFENLLDSIFSRKFLVLNGAARFFDFKFFGSKIKNDQIIG